MPVGTIRQAFFVSLKVFIVKSAIENYKSVKIICKQSLKKI